MNDQRGDDERQPRAESDSAADGPVTSSAGSDDEATADLLADAAASDELEAQLAGGTPNSAEQNVRARAARMRSVRDTLADDSDSPSDAQLEDMVRSAIRSADTADPVSTGDPADRPDAVVPLPRHAHAAHLGRWVMGAAAAVVLLLAGLVVVQSTGEKGSDDALATPSAQEAGPAADDADRPVGADSEGLPSAESEGVSGAEPDAVDATGAPEFEASERDEDGAGGSVASSPSPGGIRFTIVVPIVQG